jgi:DNA-binding response OmpR family regulator
MSGPTVETSKKIRVGLDETPIRVLNVDDDSDSLKITKKILELLDAFQVDTALSVDEAVEMMKKTKYDAIISDNRMTGKSGFDFLKDLRTSGNDVPFIFFTGKGRETMAIEALDLGADGYFNKIGDPETVYGELAHNICGAVKRRKGEEESKVGLEKTGRERKFEGR